MMSWRDCATFCFPSKQSVEIYFLALTCSVLSPTKHKPFPSCGKGIEQNFDHLNRLSSETSAVATHLYTYDKAGNRRTTIYAATGRTLVSTYDKLNRLLTLGEGSAGVPPASFTSYGYDLSGNTVKKSLPNGSTTLCLYDALNRKLSKGRGDFHTPRSCQRFFAGWQAAPSE